MEEIKLNMYRVNLKISIGLKMGCNYEESVDEFIIHAGGSDDESSSESTPGILKIATLINFCTSFCIISCMLYFCHIFIYIMFKFLSLYYIYIYIHAKEKSNNNSCTRSSICA